MGTDNKLHKKTVGGADTVIPFNSGDGKYKILWNDKNITYTFTEGYPLIIAICFSGSGNNDNQSTSKQGLIKECTCTNITEVQSMKWAKGGWACCARVYELIDVKINDTCKANMIIQPGVES